MKKLAVNVVLLPPDSVMDLALEWNRYLRKSRGENIVLGRIRYLPHISMAMGCIRSDQVEQASTILRSIATQHGTLNLTVPGIKSVSTASGVDVVTFDIRLTPELAALQGRIVSEFKPLLTQDADEKAIDDAPPISPDSIHWINHYIPDQCFDNFWPHITLGYGENTRDFEGISFQGSRLAICHLGNYCACSTILTETDLRSDK